jgi:hypothetical protein
MNNILDSFVEVRLKTSEDFLKVKETLSRIGLGSRKDNTLYQSCHIFHKQGKYYIVHFKELFLLDGKESNFSDQDLARRNKIASLLNEWGLVDIVDPKMIEEPIAPINQVKIIAHKDKANWNLQVKYTIGNDYMHSNRL